MTDRVRECHLTSFEGGTVEALSERVAGEQDKPEDAAIFCETYVFLIGERCARRACAHGAIRDRHRRARSTNDGKALPCNERVDEKMKLPAWGSSAQS
jgi:hypothetical protein